MPSALVSIIIPVYNVSNFIRESLESALNQTYKNIEYILVNDCTPDNSMEIINQMISSPQHANRNVRILNLPENGGLSNARNEGLRIATGEYIYFMDSDDIISANCIESHVKAIETFSVDFTDGNVKMVGINHNNFKPYTEYNRILDDDVLTSYFNGLHICGWNKLIRKNLLLSNKIFFKKGMLYEDMLWVYQLCSIAKSYVTVPEITYYYLIRPGSITTKNNDKAHALKQFNSFIELLNHMSDEFSQTNNRKLTPLQEKWIGKTLLIIKSRLLSAPLSLNEKRKVYNNLQSFSGNTKGLLYLINKPSYPLFALLTKVPNSIFRKLRK